MTHEDLRKRACNWLTNTKRCGVVLSEMVAITSFGEIPDAIGWRCGVMAASILVECKTSRSDFYAQKQKGFVRVGGSAGMGHRRYFLSEKDVIQAADVVDLDYGLLWASECRIQVVKEAEPRSQYDHDSEMRMLISALRRVKTREFLILVPEIPEEPAA